MTESQSDRRLLERPIALYDSACKLCVTTTDQLRELDRDHLIDWRDVFDDSVRRRFPKIDWKFAEKELHLIHRDGRVRTGARAFRDILELIGGEAGKAAAKAMDVPGVQDFADIVYQFVSDNRYKVMGKSGGAAGTAAR